MRVVYVGNNVKEESEHLPYSLIKRYWKIMTIFSWEDALVLYVSLYIGHYNIYVLRSRGLSPLVTLTNPVKY